MFPHVWAVNKLLAKQTKCKARPEELFKQRSMAYSFFHMTKDNVKITNYAKYIFVKGLCENGNLPFCLCSSNLTI